MKLSELAIKYSIALLLLVTYVVIFAILATNSVCAWRDGNIFESMLLAGFSLWLARGITR